MAIVPGYTDSTTYTLAGGKMNYFNLDQYAKIKDTDAVKVYANMTSPPNQQELVTVRAEKLNSVSNSIKRAFAPETKSGYQFSVKDEVAWRSTDADGNNHDNISKVIITCAAEDGCTQVGAIPTGKDWLPQIMRAISRFCAVTYDISDGTVTLKTDQAMLDRLMHQSAELVNVNTSQA